MCPIAIFCSPNSAKILRSISRYLQKVLQLPKYSYVLPIVTSFFRNKVSLICTQCNALPINAFLLIHWIYILVLATSNADIRESFSLNNKIYLLNISNHVYMYGGQGVRKSTTFNGLIHVTRTGHYA